MSAQREQQQICLLAYDKASVHCLRPWSIFSTSVPTDADKHACKLSLEILETCVSSGRFKNNNNNTDQNTRQ